MYLKLSNLLSIVAFKLRQKSLYFELKYYIVTKQSYLKRVYEWDRGMGKTYTLVKLAQRYKCPIVVQSDATKKHIFYLSNKKKPVEVFVANEWLRGKKYDLVLCEEGIDAKTIGEIVKPMANVIVGYKNYLYY